MRIENKIRNCDLDVKSQFLKGLYYKLSKK